MKVPVQLSEAFGAPFQERLAGFAQAAGLIGAAEDLASPRFLARSVVPHVQKLSDLFNRTDRLAAITADRKAAPAQANKGLDPYWKSSSNPAHLRLAYFLYFMPPNLFRSASVWAELGRLGYRWPDRKPLRAVEFGAGPASGACGIAVAESLTPLGVPAEAGSWALIEQDKAVLTLGAEWAENYFESLGFSDWGIRRFHRTVDLREPLLPKAAPRFNLWLMSFFLNESEDSPIALAKNLHETWMKHLEEDGLVILIEPALRAQSRRVLELRQALLNIWKETENTDFKVLLPCLGHQACGALADPEDWCHEEVTWWRPPYLREIDRLAGLDRKTLPFSYLVIARSKKTMSELLPALKSSHKLERLVSPAHKEGPDLEFYLCGQDGKRKSRIRKDPDHLVDRGDILVGAEMRGDRNSSRIEKIKTLI